MPARSVDNFQVVISENEPLDLLVGVNFVSSPKCGAINTFSGTIRDTDIKPSQSTVSPEPIIGIHYEAYESMALRQISNIVEETINSPILESGDSAQIDPNTRAYVAIRLGRVPVQEASIIICVSSTGRACSHRATMVILEKIKSLAAIWKKVLFTDGQAEWKGSENVKAV